MIWNTTLGDQFLEEWEIKALTIAPTKIKSQDIFFDRILYCPSFDCLF